MKKKFFILSACLALTCLMLGGCACSMDEDVSAKEALLEGTARSTQALVFLDCRAVSEDELEFTFSRPVKITHASFEPEIGIDFIEDGSVVKVKLTEAAAPGILLNADLLAEDENKNTVNVLVPIRSRNNRMPKLVINELRSEQSGDRFEFIEFLMKSDGNLGAMRVFIASNPKEPMIYQFLPVEVKEGERVVLHLRRKDDIYIDEYGDDLNASTARDSSAARDIWLPGNSELLRKTDAVYVMDQDDNVLDAVMFSETPDSWWKKIEFAETAEFLFNKGAWASPDGAVCGPADAVSNAGATNTKSIGRIEGAEDTNTAAEWRMSPSGGATPGTANK